MGALSRPSQFDPVRGEWVGPHPCPDDVPPPGIPFSETGWVGSDVEWGETPGEH